MGIATGYALSDDGLWRQHSWSVGEGRIVETTVALTRHMGFTLWLEEAARFIVQDLPDFGAAR